MPIAVRGVVCTKASWLLSVCLLAVAPVGAATGDKVTVHVEKELLTGLADNLAAALDLVALPAQGRLQHPILIDGFDFPALGESVASIRTAYESGLPVVVVAPTPEAQAFLDDVTAGAVDLPTGFSRTVDYGQPRLEAIAFQRRAGTTADTAEFWVAFDGDDGTPEEEQAEEDTLAASIADWLRQPPATAATPAAASQRLGMKAGAPSRPAIDDLTSAVVRKVSFQFDQGSMATVVKSWAAYSPGQDEDWYIFELTTTSQPLNFATYSLGGMFSNWEKGDANCRALAKTGCKRDRFATQVQVKLTPRTPGLELVYYGPDSDRAQDEYSYTSKFSLGGKITAGYDDKGAKGGVELSAGAEFSRSTKVTIKDATLVGISNPATDVAGWRFEMPPMRAVNDLTPYGGPSMSCDNLLQMPYPVQRGAMESRQYAIYRLPAGKRQGLAGVDLAVSLLLQESSAALQNWTAGYCNLFNCDCSPENWVQGNRQIDDRLISFPLAAHAAAK